MGGFGEQFSPCSLGRSLLLALDQFESVWVFLRLNEQYRLNMCLDCWKRCPPQSLGKAAPPSSDQYRIYLSITLDAQSVQVDYVPGMLKTTPSTIIGEDNTFLRTDSEAIAGTESKGCTSAHAWF